MLVPFLLDGFLPTQRLSGTEKNLTFIICCESERLIINDVAAFRDKNIKP